MSPISAANRTQRQRREHRKTTGPLGSTERFGETDSHTHHTPHENSCSLVLAILGPMETGQQIITRRITRSP